MDDIYVQRFLAKVNFGNSPRLAGCWLWTASTNPLGYGQFWMGGKSQLAHRVSYELTNGELRDGQVVRHACHNPSCVNPAHLLAGTHQDNMDDMVIAGRQAKGEANGRSKLTESAVREIRELHATGRFLLRELGELYGVTQQQIGRIVNNKLRKES